MEKNTSYRISPVWIVVTILLNVAFLISRLNLKEDAMAMLEGPSIGYHILLFSGLVLTLYMAIIVTISFFRNAGKNPGYMPYLLIYLIVWTLGYIGCLI